MSTAELLGRIRNVKGEAAYLELRKARAGAIVLTANMGSFEVGMAGLRQYEPKVHVLFRRDANNLFEQSRSSFASGSACWKRPSTKGSASGCDCAMRFSRTKSSASRGSRDARPARQSRCPCSAARSCCRPAHSSSPLAHRRARSCRFFPRVYPTVVSIFSSSRRSTCGANLTLNPVWRLRRTSSHDIFGNTRSSGSSCIARGAKISQAKSRR